MAVRVITLLLAVIVMTGAATSVSADLAPADDITSVDGDASADPVVAVVPADQLAAVPPRPISRFVSVPSTPEVGRMHAVSIFRPPRA